MRWFFVNQKIFIFYRETHFITATFSVILIVGEGDCTRWGK